MSIKVVAHVPSINEQVLPQIVEKFAQYGMICQFHPRFTLNPGKDAGLVEARLQIVEAKPENYTIADMRSRFEIAFKEFRYVSPLSVYPAVNQALKACSKQVIIRMHAVPTSALRLGLYFAAFLTDVTNGVLYIPRSDDYLDPPQAVEYAQKEIHTYESALPAEDWTVEPFISW